MTDITNTPIKVRATPEVRRARIAGIILLVLAAFVFWVFGLKVMGDLDATFKITLPTDVIKDVKLIVNTRTMAYVAAGLMAFLSGAQLWKSTEKRTNLAVGIGFFLFICFVVRPTPMG